MSVPKVIRELLETRIDTFEKLDVVVALCGAPHQSATVDELIQKLGLPRDAVRLAVGDLRRALLIDSASNGQIHLWPPSEGDQRAIRELVELYRDDPGTVLRVLGEISLARIRGMAARTFADAFVIGKKTEDDDDG